MKNEKRKQTKIENSCSIFYTSHFSFVVKLIMEGQESEVRVIYHQEEQDSKVILTIEVETGSDQHRQNINDFLNKPSESDKPNVVSINLKDF